MIRVSPIVFTPNVAAWSTLLDAVGLVVVEDSPGWKTYAAAHGRINLHEETNRPRVELWLEATDPVALAHQLAGEAGRVEEHPLDGGPTVWDVEIPGTLRIGVSPLADGTRESAAGADPDLSVIPLHYTPDVPGARDAVDQTELTPRIASDGGRWVDYAATDGLLALHEGTLGAVLSFEYAGSLDDLAERLASRGITAPIIDETYARTIRLPHPDGGPDIWINGVMEDMYGYHHR